MVFSFQSLNQGSVFFFKFLISKIQGSGFSFEFLNLIFQASGFSFKFLKYYHNLTIFRVILNFAQECFYLENKVGVVDFTKACGLVKFPTLPILGCLQNLLPPLYFRGKVSFLQKTPPNSPGPVRVKDSGVEMSCNLHKPGRKRSRIDLCPRFF